jgi:hypothetical protein
MLPGGPAQLSQKLDKHDDIIEVFFLFMTLQSNDTPVEHSSEPLHISAK